MRIPISQTLRSGNARTHPRRIGFRKRPRERPPVHARHENDFSYSCGFRSRATPEREREERKRRERSEQKCPTAATAAAAAATRCNPLQLRRCIDACESITRSPRARWIGRLMPAICGYCCYLTVTLCAARCRELRQGTAPREAPRREGPESIVLLHMQCR